MGEVQAWQFLANGNKAGQESFAYLATVEWWDAVIVILMEAASE
jgi:hypothetical protein